PRLLGGAGPEPGIVEENLAELIPGLLISGIAGDRITIARFGPVQIARAPRPEAIEEEAVARREVRAVPVRGFGGGQGNRREAGPVARHSELVVGEREAGVERHRLLESDDGVRIARLAVCALPEEKCLERGERYRAQGGYLDHLPRRPGVHGGEKLRRNRIYRAEDSRGVALHAYGGDRFGVMSAVVQRCGYAQPPAHRDDVSEDHTPGSERLGRGERAVRSSVARTARLDR